MAPAVVDIPTGRAPKVVGPKTTTITRPTNKLPQYLIDGARLPEHEKKSFDAKEHLNFQPPKKIYTMKEIGLEGHGISPNAVSDPFPLFTEEAVRQMRAELFSKASLENCQYSSAFAKNMIRGMGPALAPFIYDAWQSPELLAKISEVAGVELVPAIDFEIGNINISVNEGSVETNPKEGEDEMPAFAWHYDSFPFVCVTMLSDCTGMMGGETALKTATGDIIKVRGPAMGTAVVMQGRYIEHQALKALGGRERISMVTSFRPKSPFMKDESILTGIRGTSPLTEIYNQYAQYRLEILEERIRVRLKKEQRREIAKRPFDTPNIRAFLTEQKEFLEAMLEELY
ncbi:hypothetical protein BJX96DRAFT_186120 [Aspergillus floccosus]